MENVEFHESLHEDFLVYQNLWMNRAVLLNASQYGSPSSRPRQYMPAIIDLESLPTVPALSPNSIPEPHCHCNRPQMRCVVASVRTHSVPLVQDFTTRSHECLGIPECESMQG